MNPFIFHMRLVCRFLVIGVSAVLLCSMPGLTGATLFSEGFDQALLRDPVSESDPSPGVPDWNTPEESGLAWSRGADDVAGGSVEWLGWSFTRTDFWITVSGNQNRSDVFEPGANIIAVADSDEAEDGGSTLEDGYNAFLRTPVIPLGDLEPAGLVLSFQSNFRAEEDETSEVRFMFDDGPAYSVSIPDQDLTLTEVTISLASMPNVPDSAETLVVEFAHENADNNWWWAIDDVRLTGRAASVVLWSEDFEGLPLTDAVSPSETAGTAVWTAAPPSGWQLDTGETPAGGPVEFFGWTFVEKDWWATTAGDQGRLGFTTGDGTIAVADPDEYDDIGDIDPFGFEASLTSPVIDVTGVEADSLRLEFDSSWLPEDSQTGRLEIAIDGSTFRSLLVWDSEPNDQFKPASLDEHVVLDSVVLGITSPAESVQFRWSLDEAGNDWWWAIDNVRLSSGSTDVVLPVNEPPVVVDEPAGALETETGMNEAFVFTAADEDGDSAQIQVDWGDGQSAISPFVAAGEETTFQNSWRLPGTYEIRARAIDEHGLASVWNVVQSITVTGDPIITLLTPPYLQNVRKDGIVIMCETAEDAALIVRFGLDHHSQFEVPMSSVSSGAGTWFQRALIDGLDPGRLYHYQVGSMNGASLGEESHFRTAPDGPVDFRFSVWSDSQGHNHGAWTADPLEPTTSMMKHMVKSGVSFGLTTGDLAENGASYGDTRSFYLDRVATHLGTSVPWFAAWGNHDSSDPDAPLRLASDMPSRYREGFSPGHGSYSFSYAGCFFVCLDQFYQDEITNGWLEAQLSSPEARGARFRFLGIHVPPYCERWIDGSETLRNRLVPLLEEYDVDFCFSGHTHEYERGELNHVHYVITGGGSWLDHAEEVVRDWEHMFVGGAHDVEGTWARESSRGVLGEPQPIVGGLFNEYALVTIRDDHLVMDVHGFNADGSAIGVLDSLAIGEDPDSDRDGLKDSWEIANRLDPDDPDGVNGAGGDLDLDGASNLSEYLAGTNPDDPSSMLRIESVELSPEGRKISWTSVDRIEYFVQYSTDMLNWKSVGFAGDRARVYQAHGSITSAVLDGVTASDVFIRVGIYRSF